MSLWHVDWMPLLSLLPVFSFRMLNWSPVSLWYFHRPLMGAFASRGGWQRKIIGPKMPRRHMDLTFVHLTGSLQGPVNPKLFEQLGGHYWQREQQIMELSLRAKSQCHSNKKELCAQFPKVSSQFLKFDIAASRPLFHTRVTDPCPCCPQMNADWSMENLHVHHIQTNHKRY